MPIQDILSYIQHETKTVSTKTRRPLTIGEAYGTENFCMFMYALVKLEKPRVVVELGTGSGGTAALCGLATQEVGRGHVWTVDDGGEWDDLRADAQRARGYSAPKETHAAFMKKLLRGLGVHRSVTCVNTHMTETEFFAPPAPIDLLFADAQNSGAIGCLYLLRYYLTRMSAHSSLFIDRASTLNHSFLFLNYVIGELQRGKIPVELRRGVPAARLRKLQQLVETSKFTVVHLTEPRFGRPNELQNSRAWIKIEPNDFLFRDEIDSFIGDRHIKVAY